MKDTKIKFDFLFSFFIIGFSLLQMSTIWINIIFLKKYINQMFFVAIVLLIIVSIIKIIRLKISIKQWLIVFSLSVVAIVSYLITKDSWMLQFILIIIACIYEDFDKVVKWDFIIKIIVMSVLVLCYNLGMTNELHIVKNGQYRSSYGFFHPNTFSMFITIMYFEFIYLKGVNKLTFILGVALSIFLSEISGARTSLIMMLSFFIMAVSKKNIIAFIKVRTIKELLENLFIVFSVITIILTMLYNKNNSLLIIINKLTSKRLIIQKMFWENYDINLIGNYIIYNKTLDNAFIRIILNYGIIGCLLFHILYVNTIKKVLLNDKYYIILIMFITFLISGLMENLMFRITYNIFWVFICTETNMEVKKK